MSSENLSCTPPEIRASAANIATNLLPEKSKLQYKKQFQHFLDWCNRKSVENISENVLLAYFGEECKKYKASTLWSTYSKLKSCLAIYRNVDISKFVKLQAFLKRTSVGYVPKKSKILEDSDINKFIKEADNKLYLAMKIILIMGYSGACRREELTNMSIDDIECRPHSITVSIPKTKNNVSRQFMITNPDWIDLIAKYVALRPKIITHKRFFLTYRDGHCVNSPIGINTIGKVSRNIAEFLQLPNPELFTGHCFRRSSATQLANQGGDLLTVKRHGGWKSSAVAEGYVDASLKKKIEVAQMLGRQTVLDLPGCSHHIDAAVNNSTITASNSVCHDIVSNQNLPGITLSAQDTSNVSINVYNNCVFHGNKN